MIRIGFIISLFGVFLISFTYTYHAITMLGIILIGLGFAPIYPCMMHETPKRFDEKTSHALIGYQVGAACIGGSIITGGLGLLFSIASLEILVPALAVLLTSMIFITEYLNRMNA